MQPSATAAISWCARPIRKSGPSARAKWPSAGLATGGRDDAGVHRSSRGRRTPLVGRRELYRLAAAAGRGLVGILEHELRRELVGAVIHLGAEQEQHGGGIDQHARAFALDDFVAGLDGVGVFDL